MSRLLTIIVPTYNCAPWLTMFMPALTVGLHCLEERVEVVTGDNSSAALTNVHRPLR
jgi:hypothetical protein